MDDRKTTTRSLTKREREVLTLIANGCTIPQIASILSLKVSTVRTHIRRICGAMRARNQAHAVANALRCGELTVDVIVLPGQQRERSAA